MSASPNESTPPPGIYDLVEHSDAPSWLLRFTIPKDYKKSAQRWQRLGGRAVQRYIMRHRASREDNPHYYLDHKGDTPLVQATNHLTDETLTNEFIHGGVGLPVAVVLGVGGALLARAIHAPEAVELGLEGAGALSFVGNMALVAVQRYNRARLMGLADRLLRRGDTYPDGYANLLGIDAQAYANYEAAQMQQPPILPPGDIALPPTE